MAIEKRELGTQDDPDVIPFGNAVEVTPEPTRADQIRSAAEILVTEEDILVDVLKEMYLLGNQKGQKICLGNYLMVNPQKTTYTPHIELLLIEED